MDLQLQNKKVFVSGSSRGIGLAIAKKFIDEGAQVVINGRNEEELLAVSKTIKALGYVSGDISLPKNALSIINKVTEILDGLDILICNVGSSKSVLPGEENFEEWNKIFALNFFSATNIIEASVNFLEKSSGSIVCISSICGKENIIGAPVTYSVAKSALNAYINNIAVPMASKGIRINGVSPGNINFEGSVWDRKIKENPDSVKEILENNVPLKKLGALEDIAQAVIFLSSDASNFTTGSNVVIDGGQTRS